MNTYVLFFLPIFIAGFLLSGCVTVAPDTIPEASSPGSTNEIPYPKDIQKPKLSEQELQRISHKIFINETSGKAKNLLIWHENEDFPSLGIGHFIWYPTGRFQRFDETFPDLIGYLEEHHVRLPFWLLNARYKGAPWASRESFLQSQNDPEVRELKRILLNTKELQTLFFFDRLHKTIPQIAQSAPANQRQHIVDNYNALANTVGGWYPLIDYINFKGKGLKASEKYRGKGWGLLQVLQEMQPVQPGREAIVEFSRAAKEVLHRRVNNSPSGNNERRWIPGWDKRINTYVL